MGTARKQRHLSLRTVSAPRPAPQDPPMRRPDSVPGARGAQPPAARTRRFDAQFKSPGGGRGAGSRCRWRRVLRGRAEGADSLRVSEATSHGRPAPPLRTRHAPRAGPGSGQRGRSLRGRSKGDAARRAGRSAPAPGVPAGCRRRPGGAAERARPSRRGHGPRNFAGRRAGARAEARGRARGPRGGPRAAGRRRARGLRARLADKGAGAGGTGRARGPQGALTFEDRAQLLQGHGPGGRARREGPRRRRRGGDARRSRPGAAAAPLRPHRGPRAASPRAALRPRGAPSPRSPRPPDGRRLRLRGSPSHRPARARAARARGTAAARAPLEWRARGAAAHLSGERERRVPAAPPARLCPPRPAAPRRAPSPLPANRGVRGLAPWGAVGRGRGQRPGVGRPAPRARVSCRPRSAAGGARRPPESAAAGLRGERVRGLAAPRPEGGARRRRPPPARSPRPPAHLRPSPPQPPAHGNGDPDSSASEDLSSRSKLPSSALLHYLPRAGGVDPGRGAGTQGT